MTKFVRIEDGKLQETVTPKHEGSAPGLKPLRDLRPPIGDIYHEYTDQVFSEFDDRVELTATVSAKEVNETMRIHEKFLINRKCEEMMESSFGYEGDTFCLDIQTINEIMAMLHLAQLNGAGMFPVRTADGSTVEFDFPKLFEFAELALNFHRNCLIRRGELIQQIVSAKNAAEMNWSW